MCVIEALTTTHPVNVALRVVRISILKRRTPTPSTRQGFPHRRLAAARYAHDHHDKRTRPSRRAGCGHALESDECVRFDLNRDGFDTSAGASGSLGPGGAPMASEAFDSAGEWLDALEGPITADCLLQDPGVVRDEGALGSGDRVNVKLTTRTSTSSPATVVQPPRLSMSQLLKWCDEDPTLESPAVLRAIRRREVATVSGPAPTPSTPPRPLRSRRRAPNASAPLPTTKRRGPRASRASRAWGPPARASLPSSFRISDADFCGPRRRPAKARKATTVSARRRRTRAPTAMAMAGPAIILNWIQRIGVSMHQYNLHGVKNSRAPRVRSDQDWDTVAFTRAFGSGLLLAQIIERVVGIRVGGINPTPRTRAARLRNVEASLGTLRSIISNPPLGGKPFPYPLNPTFLSSPGALVDGDPHAVWGLLAHLRNACGGSVARRRAPAQIDVKNTSDSPEAPRVAPPGTKRVLCDDEDEATARRFLLSLGLRVPALDPRHMRNRQALAQRCALWRRLAEILEGDLIIHDVPTRDPSNITTAASEIALALQTFADSASVFAYEEEAAQALRPHMTGHASIGIQKYFSGRVDALANALARGQPAEMWRTLSFLAHAYDRCPSLSLERWRRGNGLRLSAGEKERRVLRWLKTRPTLRIPSYRSSLGRKDRPADRLRGFDDVVAHIARGAFLCRVVAALRGGTATGPVHGVIDNPKTPAICRKNVQKALDALARIQGLAGITRRFAAVDLVAASRAHCLALLWELMQFDEGAVASGVGKRQTSKETDMGTVSAPYQSKSQNQTGRKPPSLTIEELYDEDATWGAAMINDGSK